MARPQKKGLDYFPFDVDFFSDKKIKRLRAKYGNDGVMVYIYLICEIYKSGYYIDYDEDLLLDISDELNISENSTMQILNYLFSRSLLILIESTLAIPVKVITAKSIQRRYQEAKKGAKRDIVVDPEFWVLKKEDTLDFIKVRQKNGFSDNNDSFSEKNDDKSEKNDIKESKRKESKLKESNTAVPDSVNQIFEMFNQICTSYQRITSYSDARKKAIKARLNSGYTLDDFQRLFEKSEESDFLKGKNNRNWTASFDWLIKDANMAKVLDGNYDNRSSKEEHSYDLDEYKSFVNNFNDHI